MIDKVIVSNRSALKAKYGRAGFSRITTAVKALIAADRKRGLTTRLVFLDDAAAMRALRGKAVADATSPRQNKDAVDAVYKAARPEYLMILGAPDVVPHQDLLNPAFDQVNDPDRFARGDLSYACDAPYDKQVARFRGPTRVVGRLPDLTGAREPSHILALLKLAAAYTPSPAAHYARCFGLSADSWKRSTQKSLDTIFGDGAKLKLSPKAGPTHPARVLAPLAHFINCHGGSADPKFYGEKGKSTPVSLTSDGIKGKISRGTVAAVECCYGAELYDSVTLALPLPICQRYLAEGGYGFFGSSTIAYGPADDNGAADLIAQYFLLAVTEGASLGRATLMARQQFVAQTSELDPIDLKTLAQFSLIGDPSIHPVSTSTPTAVPKGVDPSQNSRYERRIRRAKLHDQGQLLQQTKPTAHRKSARAEKTATVTRALSNIARAAGLPATLAYGAYDVTAPPAAASGKRKSAPRASRYFVAVHKPPRGAAYRTAVVAREVDGRIVAFRIYKER